MMVAVLVLLVPALLLRPVPLQLRLQQVGHHCSIPVPCLLQKDCQQI
jgi:hypothetical protein